MTLLTLPHQNAEMPFPLQAELLLVTDLSKLSSTPPPSSSTTVPAKFAFTLGNQSHQHGQKANTKAINKRRKKSIKFNKTVQVRTILHIGDYTAEEVDACWYTSEEVHAIFDDIDMVVDCLEQANTLQGQQEEKLEGTHYYCGVELPCRRGLERKLHNSRQVTQSRIRNGCFAVLEEQELQWEEGVSDVEFISRVYKVASRSSLALAEARARASKDEKEVNK